MHKLLISVTGTTMPLVNQARNTEAIFNFSIVLLLYMQMIYPEERILRGKDFELVRVKLYRIPLIYYITCCYIRLSHACPCT